MKEQWIVDRCKLRELWLDHPEWSRQDLARKIGRSKSWVKKWLRRIRSTHLEDRQILQSRFRARKHHPPWIASEVVECILKIRDDPPRDLGRIPGPLTILYYLQKNKTLSDPDFRLPRSTRTIWKILDDHHRILSSDPRLHEPEERPAPGIEWGMDFKDVSSVPADPIGKQQHVVEILNLVDHGSSVVIVSEPRDDYTAETALQAVAEILQAQGCPDRIRPDRDPRWVGSWTAKDFPAPLLRFLMCLGIEPSVWTLRRPDKNPFVERYHRSFKYECQLLHQLQDLTNTVEVNQRYVHFYNFERPNQAVTCNNQPPRVKFPETRLLPPVPQTIDPDQWILELDDKTYKLRLDPSGRFHLGNQTYYVLKNLLGRSVVVWVNGGQHELEILIGGQLVKKLPIKGLKKKEIKFTEYLEMMSHEAVSAWRRTQRCRTTYR